LRVVVNGETQTTGAKTLGELCAALGLTEAKIATAVNGTFVPARARDSITLTENDAVEIVAPRQGG
jgi:sulfur carrier protein